MLSVTPSVAHFPNITFTYADQVDAWLEVGWVRERIDDFFWRNARRLLPEKEYLK